MDKKHLSESDICDKFIRPAMEAAGWNGMDQIYREFPLRAGRVVVRGQKAYRDKTTVVRADYALFHKPNIPLAVVEAKDNNHALGAGMPQAINYAGLLGVPFSFSSNGDGFVFRDATMATGMLEQTIALAEFPSPAELWRRYCTWKGWTPEVERIAGFYYSHSKTPRYYQINAINRTVEAIAGGQDRVLLCNAAIGAKPRFGSGPWVDDCKTGEVEVRHVARRDSVAEFQRNSRDHEVHRRTVAACEVSRPNGSPFVERQHMARVGDAKCVEPGAQDRSLLGIPGLLHHSDGALPCNRRYSSMLSITNAGWPRSVIRTGPLSAAALAAATSRVKSRLEKILALMGTSTVHGPAMSVCYNIGARATSRWSVTPPQTPPPPPPSP